MLAGGIPEKVTVPYPPGNPHFPWMVTLKFGKNWLCPDLKTDIGKNHGRTPLSVDLRCLDDTTIASWWLGARNRQYEPLHRNCSYVILEAMMVGGAAKYASFPGKFFASDAMEAYQIPHIPVEKLLTAVTAQDVYDYAQRVKRAATHQRHA